METMPLKTLNTLLRVVLDMGHSVDWVLQQIDLDFNPLDENNQNLTVIPTASYSKLYQLLMELRQDEALGLGGAYRAPPGTFRMMALFIIHARNLGDALRRAAEFYDYLDQHGEVTLDQRRQPVRHLDDSDNVLLVFQAPDAVLRGAPLVSETNILLMMQRFYSWLIATELPLKEVHFSQPAPARGRNYESLFGCPVRFEQPVTGLVVDNSLLQHPLGQNENSLRDYLRQIPHQLIRPNAPERTSSLTLRIENLLARHPMQKPPTAEQVAAELNMSPRTLHRRLTGEGSSFQAIKDGYRRNLATHYVCQPDLTIDTIATLMGFQDNSAFYRSFRKWTGESPGAYRRRLADQELDKYVS